nr:MAG TPA: hypothetical protein [Bacteriophage sp.]
MEIKFYYVVKDLVNHVKDIFGNMQNNFEQLNKLYSENFSLGFIDKDFSTKVALISLISYLTFKLRSKDSSISYLRVIKSLSKDIKLDSKFVNTLAVICSDFAYGCTSFPTFGISDKNIPAKIKELLEKHVPF